MDEELRPVLGIDLGTTFSAIARWDGRGPRIYQNKQGQDTTQSVVFYNERHNSFLVGKLAYEKYLVEPENGIVAIKRRMDDKNQEIVLGKKVLNPVQISSKILGHLYQDVQSKFPANAFNSRGVVVSVPYYFKAHQCANTREAAELAGLNFLGIIQEPIAAALSYALKMVRSDPSREREETVLVFDLGGGTFDLTVFKLIQTREKLLFEVLATGGDDRLGGLDFDHQFKEYIKKSQKVNLSSIDDKAKKMAEMKLLQGANVTKEQLSFERTYNLVIPFLTGDVSLDLDLTRPEFEESIANYIAKVRDITEDTLNKGGVRRSEITRIIKVGGSSKIPAFVEILQNGIGSDRIYGDTDPSLCVAEGAAIYAAYLDDRSVLGKEVEIITRNCHALGIEDGEGRFCPLVAQNRQLPYECTQIFTTDKDNMTEFEVAVYQGSSSKAKDNALVGKINVRGLVPKPKETLNIRITLKVNEEQRVTVVIEEPQSGIKIAEAMQYA